MTPSHLSITFSQAKPEPLYILSPEIEICIQEVYCAGVGVGCSQEYLEGNEWGKQHKAEGDIELGYDIVVVTEISADSTGTCGTRVTLQGSRVLDPSHRPVKGCGLPGEGVFPWAWQHPWREERQSQGGNCDQSSANFLDHLASMFFSLAGGFWMAHHNVHHIPDRY